ncbi:hypothetical protein L596_019472 [Steinernema carpocapsae]|uniref:Uncharacterized protein n=1 Tax=Steinernema carpocapsae TaxID=34508 RepID=A0A4U5MQR3_STECR|nr:hypothetical protein L596_019472 [Steinernema carpocapsae]
MVSSCWFDLRCDSRRLSALILQDSLCFRLCLILHEDRFGIIPLLTRFLVAGMRIEICLSFVLAFNRLKIICRLRYSDRIHEVLIGISWTIGAVVLITSFTSC